MHFSLKVRLLSEFVGAFCIVFLGTGAILLDNTIINLGSINISIIFGAVVAICIIRFVKISGAHFNPVVSFVMYIKGKLTLGEFGYYTLFQFLGAAFGSMILRFIFGNAANMGATLPSGGVLYASITEVFLTFVLIIVILFAKFDSLFTYITSSLLIGFTITLDSILGGAISGASMNPVRSLGPAIVSGNFKDVWIYIVAPFVGAIIACFVHKGLHFVAFNVVKCRYYQVKMNGEL